MRDVKCKIQFDDKAVHLFAAVVTDRQIDRFVIFISVKEQKWE